MHLRYNRNFSSALKNVVRINCLYILAYRQEAIGMFQYVPYQAPRGILSRCFYRKITEGCSAPPFFEQPYHVAHVFNWIATVYLGLLAEVKPGLCRNRAALNAAGCTGYHPNGFAWENQHVCSEYIASQAGGSIIFLEKQSCHFCSQKQIWANSRCRIVWSCRR